MSLINAKDFNEVISFGNEIKKLLIITRGEKGAISINNGKVTEVESNKNLEIIDLTGAGDLFAGGYLHGYLNNLPQEACLNKGTEMSSKIIQKIGARL
jgi:fructokinase